jgi:hypothetical protein
MTLPTSSLRRWEATCHLSPFTGRSRRLSVAKAPGEGQIRAQYPAPHPNPLPVNGEREQMVLPC